MIAIIDYGMGNLGSVHKALEKFAPDVRIVQSPRELARAEKIVLPGVGAFRDAIERLRASGMAEPIVSAVRDGTPLLGICLGLQMLFDVSYEDGEHRGLGIIPGKVLRFDFSNLPADRRLRVPQMGWNQIRWDRDVPILRGIGQDAYVYFCHSYYAAPADASVTATRTDYGIDYTSSVWRDNLYAVQFHPEKSQAVGLKMLENFVRL
jgi:imidazole glycerol-phosphate synthase subunit HisH